MPEASLCPRCGRTRGPQDRTHQWYCAPCWREYQRDRWNGRLAVHARVCRNPLCLDPFDTTDGRKRYCGRACKDSHRRAESRADLIRQKRAAPRRVCPQCGGDVHWLMRADARFCSADCEQAAHNATRKATWKIGERQEYVSRAEIYARDAGRCHLCGEHRPPDDFHLDHLVPLALGGTHEASNLAVACPSCNMSRGATRLERQASLL